MPIYRDKQKRWVRRCGDCEKPFPKTARVQKRCPDCVRKIRLKHLEENRSKSHRTKAY